MKTIRLAVIGRGKFARYFIEALKAVDEITYVGQCSRCLADARAFAAEYGASAAWDSVEALAADTGVDAVYIGSPNACHCAQAVTLLKAGKHVLCEKPVASNFREWECMCEAARQSGAVVMEAMRTVHCPGFALLRELLPRIGTVRQAVLSFCQYSSRYDNFKRGVIENAFRPELSNGSLMDIGVYGVHAMVALFGMPQSLTAASIPLKDSIDGAGSITAQYDGMQVVVLHSKIHNGTAPVFLGEDGKLTIDALSHPHRITLTGRDGSVQTFTAKQVENDMQYEAQDFVSLIQNGGGEEFRRWSSQTMEILDEVRRQTGIRFPADN